MALLKGFSELLSTMPHLIHIKRKAPNILELKAMDSAKCEHCFYMDFTKGASCVFIAPSEILAMRNFNAPFDLKLSQCATNATISVAKVDDNNRILHLYITKSAHYKAKDYILVCEFTGRHTNMIICDSHFVVIEALRHISKSWRKVRVNTPLAPLPQPANADSSAESVPSNKALLKAFENAYIAHYKPLITQKQDIIIAKLMRKRAQMAQILAHLPSSSDLETEAKTLANNGTLLFSSLHLLPNHITAPYIDVPNIDGKMVRLELPPHARDLQEAGNWYFSQSKKLNKKAQNLHLQVEQLREKLQFLDDKVAFIKRFGIAEVFEVPKEQERESEHIFIEGFKLSIGKSAKDNQKLLESSKAEDLWLHIRHVPSAHMIIHCGKTMPPNAVIYKAGEILAGLYASRKGDGDFVVDYTKRKFIKLSQNAKVHYAKHKSISYRIESSRIESTQMHID